MKISLVMATLGRVDEIKRMLDSLLEQTYKKFEIIIVDQNEHTLVQQLIKPYFSQLDLHYVRSSVRGLSFNRNIGIKLVSGQIIGFPDDDCFYASNLLEEVIKTFYANTQISICAVQARDDMDNSLYLYNKKSYIYRKDLFKKCISFNFFAKFDPLILFDPKLGVGTYFSSGEESDYLYSIFDKPSKYGIFLSTTNVYHSKNLDYSDTQRAYNYGLGFGALYKKDIVLRHHYGQIAIYLFYLLRTSAALIVRPYRKYYWLSLKGRIRGMITFKI